MEDGLLLNGNEEEKRKKEITWQVWREEMKMVGYIAGPMVAVCVSQYLLQVISMMMVGHLGELALSSTALATSFAGVTGFSLLVSLPYR